MVPSYQGLREIKDMGIRGGKNIFLSGTVDSKSNKFLPNHVLFGNGISNKNMQ